MLNLFNKKSNNILVENKKKSQSHFFNSSISENHLNKKDVNRHYSPAVKEWFNSVYVYNKNYFFKSLPITDKIVNKLIKSYFNISSDKIFKRLSVNRVFVSKAEMKHTNNKVIITVYTYNRQKIYFMNKIKKLQRIFKFIEQYKFKAIRNTNRIKFFKNKLNFLGRKKIHNYIESLYKQLYKKNRFLKKINKKLNKKIFYYYVNKPIYNMISNNRINKMNLKNPYLKNKLYILFLYIINLIKSIKTNNKLMINTFKLLGWEKDKFKKYEKQYIKNFISLLIKKELKNILLSQYYITMLCFNDYKYKSKNLLALNNIISNIYNKKVEINVVNLKYLYLNSDIFLEAITRKLKNRKNRLLKVLKKALKLVKLPSIIKYFENNFENSFLKRISNSNMEYLDKDIALNKEVISQSFYLKEGYALNSIKYKTINGVRLEGTGRLTRRLTASRSIFKLKYKGGLKNVDSSYKGKSTVILRGHVKSNVQYTSINSKTRNGAFGLKNWISTF